MKKAAEAIYKELVRQKIAVDKRRPDGRGAEEIRPITCEVGVAPRTHGSALFTRGQTQIMSLLTLGTAKEGQRIDDLSLEEERRYMHHYNFPPYSVGETGFMRGPKRRDIGHGALAQRALEPMIPALGGLPVHDPDRLRDARVERLVVDGLGLRLDARADGRRRADQGAGLRASRWASSRRATTTSSSPTSRAPRTTSATWTSRSPARATGITALQMDIKITGVTQEIMRNALEQAKRAREFILDKMAEAIPESRTELAEHAPRISTVKIDPEQIGMVIGKGGETIRALESDYDVQIDIEEDGTILIYATDGDEGRRPRSRRSSALTKEPEVGDTYTGKVVKTTEFGAFVELKKGTDGLLHVSNVGPGRVGHIEDVIARGDVLDVIVQEVDKERGRIGLKLVAKHENGGLVQPEELIERAKDAPPRERAERPPRRDGGGRGGREPRPAQGRLGAHRLLRDRRQGAATPPLQRAAPFSGSHYDPPVQKYVLSELDSGERVITERIPSVRSVALGFWIGAGSRDETRLEGRRHALHRAPAVQGHALLLGAGHRRDLRRARRRAERGHVARVHASSTSRVADHHLEQALDVMTDMVFAPLFADLDSEREVVLEEIAMYEDTPQRARPRPDDRGGLRRPSARPARDRHAPR